MESVRQMCDAGLVIENGQATWHDSIDDAIEHHLDNMKR